MDGRISQPDTVLQVPETSTVSAECLGANLEVQAHGHVVSDCGPKPLPFGGEERQPSCPSAWGLRGRGLISVTRMQADSCWRL